MKDNIVRGELIRRWRWTRLRFELGRWCFYRSYVPGMSLWKFGRDWFEWEGV